jgi:LCP family protein required for cell wall assembly
MRLRHFSIALILSALFLTGCIPGAGVAFSQFGQITPTPTPFLPTFASGGPQDVPAALIQDQPEVSGLTPARFEDFSPPTAQSDILVPNSVGRFVQPDGQMNILLLGSDQRPDDGGFRTDVILLLTLNAEGKTASLTSFPRDLYVYIPGWHVDRINGAFPHGGFEMMADTLEYNFGVRPDHYVLVNFWSFETIVEALGGLTVQVAQPLSDERDGPGDFSVPAGSVTMDGATALWYVRSRGNSSDFDRTRRTQEVLVAMFQRLLSLDALSRAAELYAQYQQTVSTDLGFEDLLPLFPLASDLGAGEGEIARYAIGADLVTPFTTSAGGAVLLPEIEAVLGLLHQALNVP